MASESRHLSRADRAHRRHRRRRRLAPLTDLVCNEIGPGLRAHDLAGSYEPALVIGGTSFCIGSIAFAALGLIRRP